MNTQQQGVVNNTTVSQELAVTLQLGVEELGIFGIEENMLIKIYNIQILEGACDIASLLVGSALGEWEKSDENKVVIIIHFQTYNRPAHDPFKS